MEINWSIVAWIVGLIFVYGFGLFEGRGQGYKRRKAEEEREKADQPPPKPTAVTADDPGLLRIRNENGAAALDLDGVRVDTSSLSPDQRKRLIEMLNVMRPWLEGRPGTPVPAPSPSPVQDKPLPAPVPTPAQPLPAPPPVVDATPSKPVSAPKKGDKLEAASTSIVEQINTILQAQILNTRFASQGLSLMESPSGGVNVYIGINWFEGVDAVPDEEIKSVIRAAIAEWERKYTPGLG
jgi:hypothetical protein